MAEAEDPEGSAKPPMWPVVDKSSPYATERPAASSRPAGPAGPSDTTYQAPTTARTGASPRPDYRAPTAPAPEAARAGMRVWLVLLAGALAALLAFGVGFGLGALAAVLSR